MDKNVDQRQLEHLLHRFRSEIMGDLPLRIIGKNRMHKPNKFGKLIINDPKFKEALRSGTETLRKGPTFLDLLEESVDKSDLFRAIREADKFVMSSTGLNGDGSYFLQLPDSIPDEVEYNRIFHSTSIADRSLRLEPEIQMIRHPVIIFLDQISRKDDFQELLDTLSMVNKLDDVMSMIKNLLPEFQTFGQMEAGDGLYIELEREILPLSTHGKGFLSIIHNVLISTLVVGGILIMEGGDVNLHLRYKDLKARSLVQDIKNKQVFLSTHSSEFLDCLLEYGNHRDVLERISIHRLNYRNGLKGIELETLTGS